MAAPNSLSLFDESGLFEKIILRGCDIHLMKYWGNTLPETVNINLSFLQKKIPPPHTHTHTKPTDMVNVMYVATREIHFL